jgi:hypothetical protein
LRSAGVADLVLLLGMGVEKSKLENRHSRE